MANTQTALNKQNKLLSKLKKDIDKQQAGMDKQQKLLAEQIRASYKLGPNPMVKLLLNQEDPSLSSRMMTYYQYLNQARSQAIASIHDDIRELLISQTELQHQAKKLEGLVKTKQQEQQQLTQQKAQRKKIIRRLNKELSSKRKRLRNLASNKKNLERLLRKLKQQQRLANYGEPFYKHRGKLPWPTHGIVTTHFGAYSRKNRMHSHGWFIATQQGRSIHAIAPGKVVFADWLRGFGMLIIIDHGSGYMSLYAHNQSLYATLGNWVKAGEIIATTGHSGGYSQNGLYFEIRRRGKPVDPQLWLNRRGRV